MLSLGRAARGQASASIRQASAKALKFVGPVKDAAFDFLKPCVAGHVMTPEVRLMVKTASVRDDAWSHGDVRSAKSLLAARIGPWALSRCWEYQVSQAPSGLRLQ